MANKEKTMGPINCKVIVLHGWAYSVDKWESFIKAMKNYGTDILMLSIPGLTAEINRVWTLEDYVSWLKETLDKETGQVILVAHSNGGRIAIPFAAKYPEKLRHLILIDSAGIYHNELPIRLKRILFGGLAKLGRTITSSDKLRSLLYKLARAKDYEQASPLMQQTMANLISVDLRNDLGKIRVPTTIIWGQLDKYTPLSDGKLMHRLVKGSKLHVINFAKHSPQYTNPQEVSKVINELI